MIQYILIKNFNHPNITNHHIQELALNALATNHNIQESTLNALATTSSNVENIATSCLLLYYYNVVIGFLDTIDMSLSLTRDI